MDEEEEEGKPREYIHVPMPVFIADKEEDVAYENVFGKRGKAFLKRYNKISAKTRFSTHKTSKNASIHIVS